MTSLDHTQLQMFCEKHALTVNECARLIGVSTQTLYNAIEGKSLKPETRRKISNWLHHQNQAHYELSLNKGREALETAFHSYRESLQKEWQRYLPKLSYPDQITMIESMRQLDLQFESLLRYHEVFLRLLAASEQQQSS